MAAVQCVEVLAHGVEPSAAVVQDCLRCEEGLSGGEFPAECFRVDPDLGADIAELIAFCLGKEVPAVDQMKSVDFPFFFRCIR